jgi:hypothetical protein
VRPRDMTHRRGRYQNRVDQALGQKNRTKSKARAKVEQTIGVIKRLFAGS